jgi:FtsZ-binding cell division protein ZapB
MISRTVIVLVAVMALLAVGATYFYLEDESHQAQNGGLESTVTALQNEVSLLRTQNADLNSTVTALRNEVTLLRTQDSQLQNQITSLQTALSSLGGQVPASIFGVERLVLVSYVSNDSLVVSIGNMGVTKVTVTQILFDGSPVASSSIALGGSFTTSGNGFDLASGAIGTLNIAAKSLGSLTTGVSYPFTVTTEAGDSYQGTIIWP